MLFGLFVKCCLSAVLSCSVCSPLRPPLHAQVNSRLAEEIRSDLASRTTSAGMKEILELEYKVGLLELENMELEYSRMLHDLVVRRKDMKLRKFKLMVCDLLLCVAALRE